MKLAQRIMMALGGRLPIGFGGRAPAGLPAGIHARLGRPAVPSVTDAVAAAQPLTAGQPLRVQASASQDEAELLIYDVIGEDWWTGGGVTAQAVVGILNALGGVDLKVRINSVGGDVMDGTAIVNTLAGYKGKTTASIEGWACSMATGIASACDRVEAYGNIMYMIHRASTVVWGTAQDLRDTADMMDKVDAAMVAVYAAKTGKSSEEINALMDEKRDTWLSADEAKEWGFVDEVLPAGRFTACLDETAITALQSGEGAQLLLTNVLPAPLAAVLGDNEAKGVVRVDGEFLAVNGTIEQRDDGGDPGVQEGSGTGEPVAGDETEAGQEDAGDQNDPGVEAGQGGDADPVKAERERAKAIRAACQAAGLGQLADQFIDQGLTLQQAQSQLLAIKASLDDTDPNHSTAPQGNSGGWTDAYTRAGATLKQQ